MKIYKYFLAKETIKPYYIYRNIIIVKEDNRDI